jgi:FSR family fosmidomycin resistance protein-like MFS transporter
VDAGCGFLLFHDLTGLSDASSVVILYNVIAFGGQVPIGLLADRLGSRRGFAAAGMTLTAAGILLGARAPLMAAVVVAVGNALFHVGAGADVLLRSGRAAAGGVFVGPGAIGLFAGIWLGRQRVDAGTALAILLLSALPLVLHLTRGGAPGAEARRLDHAGVRPPPWLLAVMPVATALLASVLVRAFVGTYVGTAWRLAPAVPLGLALAAATGKVLGGFVADRGGWSGTSVLALTAAALLWGIVPSSPAAAVVAMLLLQSTMPVTLKATHLLMPARPGLAFGLPCLALVLGAFLSALSLPWLHAPAGMAGALLISGALVALALRASGLPGTTSRPSGVTPSTLPTTV